MYDFGFRKYAALEFSRVFNVSVNIEIAVFRFNDSGIGRSYTDLELISESLVKGQ
jgi:hypothetical protein